MPTLIERIQAFLNPGIDLATVSAVVDDSPGWTSITGRPHDYDPSEIQEMYQDALTAWRKNPIAWRIIAITTDYVIGDDISIVGRTKLVDRFTRNFWNHANNMMPIRIASMLEELSRSGDIFCILFRNPQDGMSYIRFVTKDRIQKIKTADNDWEKELIYYETQPVGDPKAWYSPNHPSAPEQDAVMLHYSINRPVGALLGESDLATMIPWLLRYSRMLEDRVRLHWAVRAFLWIVTVPSNKVQAKIEQSRKPPDAGSIIVKDESENWEAATPLLRGSDARYDMQAVRAMIDAGSGFPPHWRGDAGDISLATAQAMTGPTERHLLRRQKYFIWLLQDLIYQALLRSAEIGKSRKPATTIYEELFIARAPDLSRFDNEILARSARDIMEAFGAVDLSSYPMSMVREAVRMFYKFAGETIDEADLDKISQEIADLKPPNGSQGD